MMVTAMLRVSIPLSFKQLNQSIVTLLSKLLSDSRKKSILSMLD
jgi:hypothetical protein